MPKFVLDKNKNEVEAYCKTETDELFPKKEHTHDDRYYTESEVDSKLNGKANSSHTHDDRYFTESEITTKLAAKANTSDLKSGATTTINKGTAAPSGGSNGDVYIQYFT